MDDVAPREVHIEVEACRIVATATLRRKDRPVWLVAGDRVLAEGRGAVTYAGPPFASEPMDTLPESAQTSRWIQVTGLAGRGRKVFDVGEAVVHLPEVHLVGEDLHMGQPGQVDFVVDPECAPGLVAHVEMSGPGVPETRWTAPVGPDGVAPGPVVVFSGLESFRYGAVWNGVPLGWRFETEDLVHGLCTDVDRDNLTNCAGDCDDWKASVRPGFPDVPWDELDNDCDGVATPKTMEGPQVVPAAMALQVEQVLGPRLAPTWLGALNPWGARGKPGVDLDADGVPAPADCDDRDPLRTPGRPEAANCRDDDCDGQVDEGVDWADLAGPEDGRDAPTPLGFVAERRVLPLLVGGKDAEDWLSVDVAFYPYETEELRIDVDAGSPGWRLDVWEKQPDGSLVPRFEHDFDGAVHALVRTDGAHAGGRRGLLTGGLLRGLGELPTAAGLVAGAIAVPGALVHDAATVMANLPGGERGVASGAPTAPLPVPTQGTSNLWIRVRHPGPVCPAELTLWYPSRTWVPTN